jgi:hypothetical protein
VLTSCPVAPRRIHLRCLLPVPALPLPLSLPATSAAKPVSQPASRRASQPGSQPTNAPRTPPSTLYSSTQRTLRRSAHSPHLRSCRAPTFSAMSRDPMRRLRGCRCRYRARQLSCCSAAVATRRCAGTTKSPAADLPPTLRQPRTVTALPLLAAVAAVSALGCCSAVRPVPGRADAGTTNGALPAILQPHTFAPLARAAAAPARSVAANHGRRTPRRGAARRRAAAALAVRGIRAARPLRPCACAVNAGRVARGLAALASGPALAGGRGQGVG